MTLAKVGSSQHGVGGGETERESQHKYQSKPEVLTRVKKGQCV